MLPFNLRIRGRLFGGFGALILFGVVLAGFAVWQLLAIRESVDAMTVQSTNAIRAGGIATELHAIRRGILRYTFDQNADSLADADKRLANISTLLEAAVRTVRAEERRVAYKDIEKDIGELKSKRIALEDTIKQMIADRTTLYAEGDKLAANMKKLTDATRRTPSAEVVAALDAEILRVRMSNWRFLVSRNQQDITIFRNSVKLASELIANLERFDLPQAADPVLASIKNGLGNYSGGFEKTSSQLMLGDELYYKSVTPLIVNAIGKIDRVVSTLEGAFARTTGDVNQRIAGTVTMQQMVAGAALILGLLIAFLIARGIIRPLSGPDIGHERTRRGSFRRRASRAGSEGRSRGHGAGCGGLQDQSRGKRRGLKPKQKPDRIKSPRSSANGICISSQMPLRKPSARSLMRYHRLRPSLRLQRER